MLKRVCIPFPPFTSADRKGMFLSLSSLVSSISSTLPRARTRNTRQYIMPAHTHIRQQQQQQSKAKTSWRKSREHSEVRNEHAAFFEKRTYACSYVVQTLEAPVVYAGLVVRPKTYGIEYTWNRLTKGLGLGIRNPLYCISHVLQSKVILGVGSPEAIRPKLQRKTSAILTLPHQRHRPCCGHNTKRGTAPPPPPKGAG